MELQVERSVELGGLAVRARCQASAAAA
jgi:hypothetical protein